MTMTMQKIANELSDSQFHGVQFWDFNSITCDPEKWSFLVTSIADRYRDQKIDMIVGLDARGFLLSGALSLALGVGSVTARKPGKLPGETVSTEYGKEYSAVDEDGNETIKRDVLHLQKEHVAAGMRVLIVDDVLATGGTAEACVELVEMLNAEVVGIAVAIEIPHLEGRGKLVDYQITSEISIIDEVAIADVEHCTDILFKDRASGNVVLLERSSGIANGIAMSGGRIDPGESATQAILREVEEETGYSLTDLQYATVLTGQDRDPRGVMVSIVFTGEGTLTDPEKFANGEYSDGIKKGHPFYCKSLTDLPADAAKFAFDDHFDFITARMTKQAA